MIELDYWQLGTIITLSMWVGSIIRGLTHKK